jgi:hypothetical protein
MSERGNTLGYSRKAGTWIPTDTQNGEVSVAELQRKMKRDQQEASDWATSTWDRPNTLNAKQIAVLDGKNTVAKEGDFNAIGQNVAIESGDDPRGFESGVYKPKGPFIDGDNSPKSN